MLIIIRPAMLRLGIPLLPANIAGDGGQWQTVYMHGRNLLRPL